MHTKNNTNINNAFSGGISNNAASNDSGCTDTSCCPPQGTIKRDQPKIGRNTPCLCGSEKKYKKCCGR